MATGHPTTRRPARLALAGLLAGATAVGVAGLAQTSPLPPISAPLVLPADLAYAGAFRLPPGESDRQSFDYGATAMAYSASRNSLLAVGHDWFQLVAEMDVPEPGIASTPASLPAARLRAPFADVLQGQIGKIGEGSAKIGGLLPWGPSLIVTAYLYYDAGATQVRSHFRAPLDRATGASLAGPFQVGRDGAGFVSGYMTPIPEAWRSTFGGPALTGQCCLSIISRTSFGPSASVFDPADVGVRNPVPSRMVLGYPASHPTLGACEQQSTLFNCTTSMGGMVFPDGTRSVLFFGRQGTGPYCYGTGGANGECPDPVAEGKGGHAYPYVFQVWAYDATELAAVAAGRRRPWDIRPYRTWTLDLPHAAEFRELTAAAWDEGRRRIFLAANYRGGERLVHVLTLRSDAARAGLR